MLVMVVFFIAFRWIHLSTPLIRLFLLVLILLLMPTLNFLPVWFALSLLRFRLQIGRAVQQECRDRARMPSSASKKKSRLLLDMSLNEPAIIDVGDRDDIVPPPP